MAQLNLHLVQVSLHLLLDSRGIVSAPDLSIQSALHGVNHPLAVPLDLLHLLILLCQLPVHLTFNLVELQLDAQDLRLFVFQSSLSLFKSCLDLSLLCLHLLLGLLQLMDALASLTNLFSQIRDLLLQVLVFTLHGLQLIQSFLIRVLHLEQFSAQRTCLLLSSFKLCLTLLKLLLPLCQHLVKGPLLLVQVGGQPISSLHINHEVLHLTLEPLFGLLQRCTLGVHSLNLLLSLLKTQGQLFLGFLKLLSALDGISFILSSPLSHLAVGLGHTTLQLSLGPAPPQTAPSADH